MVNKITLEGRVSSDLKVFNFDEQNKLVKFNFEHMFEDETKTGSKYSTKHSYVIDAWNELGDSVKVNCRKGSKLFIEGRLRKNFFKTNKKKSIQYVSIELSEFKFV